MGGRRHCSIACSAMTLAAGSGPDGLENRQRARLEMGALVVHSS
jgi:hypothetical protein